MKPVLIYHAELTNDDQAAGRLELWDVSQWPEIRTIDRFIAISGLPGWQRWEDQDARGRGPIPREDKAKITCYMVATVPQFVPASEQPGIAGNFYEITPSFVDNDRGLFGVHRDANVEGTAGCIGLKTEVGWKAFQAQMCSLLELGIKQVPLKIGYS
jgi:hypothetical protein